MPQFDIVIINQPNSDIDECVNSVTRYNEGANIHNVTPLAEKQIASATEKYTTPYRCSKTKGEEHFVQLFPHIKAWRIGYRQQKDLLVVDSNYIQTTELPGNIQDFYTEVFNLCSGDWEFEQGIAEIPKVKVRLGQDSDYDRFVENSLPSANAYLIKKEACYKALHWSKYTGWLLPQILFNSISFDVKYYRRKLFV